MKQHLFPTRPFEGDGRVYALRIGTDEIVAFDSLTTLLEKPWFFGMPCRMANQFYAHYNQNLECWFEPAYRLLDESFEPLSQAYFNRQQDRHYLARRKKRITHSKSLPGGKPSGGSYYRHPRTLNEMKERERLSDELDAEGYAHLDRSRRKKLPTTWDDLYAYRLRNWKKQRQTQWKQ